MRCIKKHKLLIGILVLFLIILIGILLIIGPSLFFNSNKLYGNRLNGIEEHKISDTTVNEIKNAIKEKDNIKDVNYKRVGRILNFEIKVSNDINIDETKSLSNIILEKIDDEDKKYYDIQLFLVSDEESEIYPKIGYKHKTSESFVWSNN